MDISNIAQTGRIEVDAVKLTKVLRREYIRYTFRKNIHMSNGTIIVNDKGMYELHYSIYDSITCKDVYRIHPLNNEQADILKAFDVVINAVIDL